MRWPIVLLLGVLATGPAASQQDTSLAPPALEPAGTGGLPMIDRALERLSGHRRLLIVGAHPDDEDTTLLALVGSGLGGEAAYLSLSRGEGGQNLIGPELGVGLGLVRTGELLAARTIEGTRQYFTRAYDFGYTRSLDETFERWPREVLLGDAVRVVRTFKPQVVVAIFPADSRAGHGQHQAAGVMAEELFAKAGPPDRYPDLTDDGLPPWQPQVLYRRAWWNPEEATSRFALEGVEPFSGRSVLQIAGASRSSHRSQDMGTLQPLGGRQGGLIWVTGETAEGVDGVFAGVDTSLSTIAELLPDGAVKNSIQQGLETVAALALEGRAGLSAAQPSAAIPSLIEICSLLDGALRRVADLTDEETSTVVADLLREKRRIASLALAAAAGVAVDALADRDTVAIGESFEVTATLWNSGQEAITVEEVEVETRLEWPSRRLGKLQSDSGMTGLQQWGFEVDVPGESPPTVPYFLTEPLVGDLYDWSRADSQELGQPLQRPPATVWFRLSIAGTPVNLAREVVYRVRDQASGEVRLPIRAVPAIEVETRPSLMVWPQASVAPREIEVLIRSHSSRSVTGELRLNSDWHDWPASVPTPFHIDEPGGQQVLRIALEAPQSPSRQRIGLTAEAVLADGRRFDAAYPLIRYPHIRPMSMSAPSRVGVQPLDLQLPSLERVGYIRGASDRVPEILREIGLPVEVLTAVDLRVADLAAYDAIVVGSRAYETDSVLSEVNSRLLRYVENGGRLLVQYQQYQFVRGGFAPAALSIDRPHGRVTDETAPVSLLQPDHPVFRSPNRLSEEDWLGWIQERGLYFAAEWDPVYLPLLSLHDDGQPAQAGALLVAEIGQGIYVYTGLAFFRQLPAGVPGAIRLFVNLLALEKT